jgi:hypothetical protein
MTFNLCLKKGLVIAATLTLTSAWAGPREQAHRLHNRLTGVPPTMAVLSQMENLIQSGNAQAAAEIAMQNPRFYDVTVKNWAKDWTNEAQTNRVPLNDFVATVIGLIRDDMSFDQVLYGDHLYVSNDGGAPAYDIENNDHYAYLENNRVSLAQTLQRAVQSQVTGIPDTAGVITTRASGEAFFEAGTNRAMTRFTFMNFLCKDFEALHDITVPDVYVRRDVDRAPGGDSRQFKNKCVGCHAGQDALGGAFAYFDWDGDKVTYTPNQVVPKVNANVLFSDGHQVTDDSWTNLWATGQNAVIGWRGNHSGTGAKSFGRYLASTQQFSRCMAEKVFKLVCVKDPSSATEIAALDSYAAEFEENGEYNMKDLISKTSTLCLGQ